MFENEEKQLREVRSKLEELPIPSEQLDQAIQHGFTIADMELRAQRRKRRKSLWSTAVAVIFLLAFVTSIRVSPAFASAVSTIPGMGKLVELIQYDKGLQGIVANDYYQQIGVSQTKDDVTLTIEGIILDETGMVLSLTLEAPYSIKTMGYKNVDIYNDDKKIPPSAMSYDYPEQQHENRKEDVIDVLFPEKKTFDSQDFTVKIQLDNAKETMFSIPFTVPKEVKKGKVYTLNEEVEIEDQKMTIQDVTIYPLRVAVNIAFDESNSMQILNFEDLRIEDEKGEVWSSIQNGISGRGFAENERIFYLQSNYFEQPEKLYFKMNTVQALSKEEAFLLIDTEKQEVLRQPSVGELEVIEITRGWLEARLPMKDKEFNYALFFDMLDADGEEIETRSQGMWTDKGYEHFDISFDQTYGKNPLKISFSAYPNYINGDVSIELE